MAIHHHRYLIRAKQHAKQLRKRGYVVTIVRYDDGQYGVYSYRDD